MYPNAKSKISRADLLLPQTPSLVKAMNMDFFREALAQLTEQAINPLNSKYQRYGVSFHARIVDDPHVPCVTVYLKAFVEERVYRNPSPNNPFERVRQELAQFNTQINIGIDPIRRQPYTSPDEFRIQLNSLLHELENQVRRWIHVYDSSNRPPHPWESEQRRIRLQPLELGSVNDNNIDPPLPAFHEMMQFTDDSIERTRQMMVGFDFENRPIREMGEAALQKLRGSDHNLDCQKYNHTSHHLRPCAIHPGKPNCEGCVDYIPHPLGKLFDFGEITKVVIKQNYYTVCPIDVVGPGKLLTSRWYNYEISRALTLWQEAEMQLLSRPLYFVGDRKAYQQAIEYLEVEGLPYFLFKCMNQELWLFHVEA